MEKSIHLFEEIYKSPPEVFSAAPGRINIIGEHTDYNQGYVLPAAIDLRNYFLCSRRDDKKVCVWAENIKQKEEFYLKKMNLSEQNKWINYIKGIFWVLEEEGFNLQGIDAFLWGDIPVEAGLSSSAALEVSVICGLNALFNLGLSPKRMAKLAQMAENDFVGVKCGLMDQFISVLGERDKALFLDCESLQHELIPICVQKAGLSLVVYNSGVRRELASSEYNKRRIEASNALDFLRKFGMRNYKEISLSILEKRKETMDETLFKRARHIISENERVKKSVEALKRDDFPLLGELLFQSHESLRDDYEVSCPELDLLYETSREFSGSYGARLTGAGFGGAGIVLIKKEEISDFKRKILQEVEKKGLIQPEFYEINIGEGAEAYCLNREEKG